MEGSHCTRFKRTRGGKRCAKFAGGGLGRGTKGKRCTRFKRTKKGKRCAHFAGSLGGSRRRRKHRR